MDPELGACLFHKRWQELGEYSADGGDQAGFGVVGGHVGDVLETTKRSSPVGSGRGRKGGSERRVQSRSTPSEVKPGSLWTCGSALSPAAIPRVCYWPLDCTMGSPHSSVHPGTLWC